MAMSFRSRAKTCRGRCPSLLFEGNSHGLSGLSAFLGDAGVLLFSGTSDFLAASYFSIASMAARDSNTMRSLLPLPRIIRKRPSWRKTLTGSETSSLTRMRSRREVRAGDACGCGQAGRGRLRRPLQQRCQEVLSRPRRSSSWQGEALLGRIDGTVGSSPRSPSE